MALFRNIKHVERKVYAHTFLNEIVLFFMYKTIDVSSASATIEATLSTFKEITIARKTENVLMYKDQEAMVSITSNGVLVSLPSREYHDFKTTADLWAHLETILNTMRVTPMLWTFTKGNCFIFKHAIPDDKREAACRLVLSAELLSKFNDNDTYAEESTDGSCVFTCRYELGNADGKAHLNLRIMLTSLSYSLTDIYRQVMTRNDDMFDCWHWCVSEQVINLMESKRP